MGRLSRPRPSVGSNRAVRRGSGRLACKCESFALQSGHDRLRLPPRLRPRHRRRRPRRLLQLRAAAGRARRRDALRRLPQLRARDVRAARCGRLRTVRGSAAAHGAPRRGRRRRLTVSAAVWRPTRPEVQEECGGRGARRRRESTTPAGPCLQFRSAIEDVQEDAGTRDSQAPSPIPCSLCPRPGLVENCFSDRAWHSRQSIDPGARRT